MLQRFSKLLLAGKDLLTLMNSEDTNTVVGGCIALVIRVVLGTWALIYLCETWLPKLVHHPVSVSLILAALVSLFVGNWAIGLAILMWFLGPYL